MNHFYHEIQGWFIYQSIYDQAITDAADGAHFVEIGSWRGRSSAYMAVAILNSNKNIRFDCVDTWLGSLDEEVHQTDPAVVNATLYTEFLNNMAPVAHVVTPHRMHSQEAALLYDNKSLDLVMIDAGHSYTDVLADIRAWLPKVKSGGTIAGDDYAWPGVNQAVTELIPNAHIMKSIGCWSLLVG